MGNRAVILPKDYTANTPGVYVHWNGGRASVDGFLGACKALGYRDPVSDDAYGMARLCFAVGTYFAEDGLCVGIGTASTLDTDNGDNGTYLVGKDWTIVGREHAPVPEEIDSEKTKEITETIVARVLRMRERGSDGQAAD